MYLLTSAPYLIIGLGLILGKAGLRPALLSWGVCILGGLSGLAVTIAILGMGQPWVLAVLSFLPFIIVLIMVIKDVSYPLLNDVATDLDTPTAFTAALHAPVNASRDMTYPESFKLKVRNRYPNVRPLILDEPADQAFDRVINLVKSRPNWRITHQDPAAKIIEAEAVTSFLGFVDDVVIQVSPQQGASRVDMRSKSREGAVDAGKNAKRIEKFLKQLRQAGGVQSSDHSAGR
ncbi:DUF1499 domain-containing protein [uncultured Litoreibacter sp.]|uniref:DUF1499 domain-containing protein n=1 Tax=uncultured Litoreibacter sp. TaxID=1392394 RepID=UPI0026087419|nr:DUF1499 domain-containing protein [uncultured Litoreibacter sp.]